ncbi:hypothetical protein [Streptomyces sindenensis]|uniref:Uncharacterized protein n=1 Tax=Streptomyces sindenensis TaxID=67363 RepID=A0ABW6ENY9_9ACTN|nr:hypothetical protein [Streptomyces sindenensis]GGP50971.1 hypothetical protein GCM10010231_22510 [Streptomyces sindenensis]
METAPAAELTAPADAVGLVPVTEEDRTGRARSSVTHGSSGDDPGVGWNTRAEVVRTGGPCEDTIVRHPPAS